MAITQAIYTYGCSVYYTYGCSICGHKWTSESRIMLACPKCLMKEKPKKQKVKKLSLNETQIKGQIKEYLSLDGWFHFYLLQGIACHKGSPDIIAIKQGRTIYLEIKQLSGQQSKYQKRFQFDIESHGGEYLLVHSLDELIEYLKKENSKWQT